MRFVRLTLLPLAAALAAGCVSQGPFPSLAPRPAEGADPLRDPERAVVVVPSDPALRRRLVELRAQAERGQRAFEAAFASTAAAVGRAGGEGSDSWIEAQQALSRLEAARADATAALALTDGLSVERAEVATGAEDLAAIDALIEEIGRMTAAQQARIDALKARLSR